MYIIADINDMDFYFSMRDALIDVYDLKLVDDNVTIIKDHILSSMVGVALQQYASDPVGYGNGCKSTMEYSDWMWEYLNGCLKISRVDVLPTDDGSKFCIPTVLNTDNGDLLRI